MSNRLLIAIVDKATNDFVGQVTTFRNVAVATRHFDDVMRDQQPNAVNKFPKDHDLVLLGEITEDLTILPNKQIIITGEEWLATEQQRQTKGE